MLWLLICLELEWRIKQDKWVCCESYTELYCSFNYKTRHLCCLHDLSTTHTHTETFLAFSLLSPTSLFPYHLPCQTHHRFIHELGSETNLYTQLQAHHLHARNLSFPHTLTISTLFPSAFNKHLFCSWSSVLRTVLPPLLVRAGSTIKAPCKTLHWNWCFILQNQLLENQHGSVQNVFVFKKQNSCLLRQSFWLFFFFFFLRFAKTLIQCLCFNREILWF